MKDVLSNTYQATYTVRKITGTWKQEKISTRKWATERVIGWIPPYFTRTDIAKNALQFLCHTHRSTTSIPIFLDERSGTYARLSFLRHLSLYFIP